VIKGKDEEGEKFKDYFKWEEPLKRIPSHRFLAITRGESEGFLRTKIAIEEEQALDKIEQAFIKTNNNELREQLQIAAKDSFKRLISSSIETEFKNTYKEKSDIEAIDVFAKNLKQLLLAPPLGQRMFWPSILGFELAAKWFA